MRLVVDTDKSHMVFKLPSVCLHFILALHISNSISMYMGGGGPIPNFEANRDLGLQDVVLISFWIFLRLLGQLLLVLHRSPVNYGTGVLSAIADGNFEFTPYVFFQYGNYVHPMQQNETHFMWIMLCFYGGLQCCRSCSTAAIRC